MNTSPILDFKNEQMHFTRECFKTIAGLPRSTIELLNNSESRVGRVLLYPLFNHINKWFTPNEFITCAINYVLDIKIDDPIKASLISEMDKCNPNNKRHELYKEEAIRRLSLFHDDATHVNYFDHTPDVVGGPLRSPEDKTLHYKKLIQSFIHLVENDEFKFDATQIEDRLESATNNICLNLIKFNHVDEPHKERYIEWDELEKLRALKDQLKTDNPEPK